MNGAERGDMSDEDLDRLIESARSKLTSELDRVADIEEGLRLAERAAADADNPEIFEDPAAILTFPLPVPEEPAALAAAGPAGGSPPVARAQSPDGLATYLLYRRGDGEYWLEVSLSPDAATPAIVAVSYAAAAPGGAGGQRYLLVPVSDTGDGIPASLLRLPSFAVAAWYGTSPIDPADVPAWAADVVRASVDAAVTAATVLAWHQVAEFAPWDIRRLILRLLRADDD